MTMERTTVPYPTHGPGDGRSWHEYFTTIHAARPENRVVTPEEEEAEAEATLVVPSRYIARGDPVPNPIWTWEKLLEKHGWETVIGYRQEFTEGQPKKSGDNKGEMNPDKRVHVTWVNGRKAGKGVVSICYRWNELGKGGAMCDYRIHKGELRLYSDAEMRSYVTSED